VPEESYINSTNDLGAMEMIARANSISDAKEQKLLALRPESSNLNRMKSTEIHSRFSKNVDNTKSAIRGGNDQFTDNSLTSKDVSLSSRAKQVANFPADFGGASSFKLGPCGQAIPRDLISSSTSSVGPLKYNVAVMGEKGSGKSTLI